MGNGRFEKKHTVDETFLEGALTSESAWFLGVMGADGCNKNNLRFSISQSGENGKKIIEYISKILKFSGPIYFHEKANSYSIDVGSPKLCSRLSDYSCVPRKSLIYEFPKKIDTQHYRNFLRGYVDGDGSVGIYKTNSVPKVLLISFVGTRNFIEECIRIIPEDLRIKSFRIIKKAKNLCEVRVSGRKAVALGKWLWSDPELPIFKKQIIYNKYIQHISNNPTPMSRLLQDKRKVFNLFKTGAISTEVIRGGYVQRPFQTIYKWRVEYDKLGKDRSLSTEWVHI